MSASVETKQWKPPYTSFRTFLNLILQMAGGDKAIPPRIDRSFLGGSEGSKTQLLFSLKALGLISESGEVLPPLTELVAVDDARRPYLIKLLLQTFYPKVDELTGLSGTQQQLEEIFSSYGLSGSTRRKAVAFYLHAAQYARHPVSANFKAAQARKGRRPGSKNRKRPQPAPESHTPPPAMASDVARQDDPAAAFRQKYLDLLMKKAEDSDTLDEKLLDRIEALLGYRDLNGEGETRPAKVGVVDQP